MPGIVPGDAADDILARADFLVKTGDLQGAVVQLQALQVRLFLPRRCCNAMSASQSYRQLTLHRDAAAVMMLGSQA